MANNPPHTIPVRADWSTKILKHLHHQLNNGEIQLNQFAIDVLKIDPNDPQAGHELNLILQGMEDLHQIFYKTKEKSEGGFKIQSLNTVSYSAMLQYDGYRMMAEKYNAQLMTRLTLFSVLIAATASLISLASVFTQVNGKTDKQLEQINIGLQKQSQLLENMQQSQKGIDASLHRIADSLSK
jgi:hypothetical protein